MKEQHRGPGMDPALHSLLLPHRSALEGVVQELLLRDTFKNRYTLQPNRLGELARGIVDELIAFLLSGDEEAARTRGRLIAREGLGESTVLAVDGMILEYCLRAGAQNGQERMLGMFASVDCFRRAVVSGYIAELEDQILASQEQLHRALSVALDDQRRELYVRNHAINTSINGILITDLEGRVRYVNAAFLKICGFQSPDEPIGQRITTFWEGTAAKEVFEQLPRTGGWHGELSARRRDGSTFDVETSLSVIRDETGLKQGIMCSFIDITESKRLRARVFHRQKMEALGELAGGIAHDFNNLLTAITGFVQLLLSDASPGTQLESDLLQIKTAVDRGAALTKQLRYFTRQASGTRQVIDVNDIVTETRNLLGRTLPFEIIIEVDLESEPWLVEADPSQVSQVLMNLCVNARDAILSMRPAITDDQTSSILRGKAAGGTLRISSANMTLDDEQARAVEGRSGRFVRLRVQDDGIGMPPSIVEKLFEPFFTTKELRSGSGLGLAVVYGIVQNHRGFIAVQSEAGVGSTFDVYLPAAEGKRQTPPIERRAMAEHAGKGRILVIDDEHQVGALLERALTRWGYSVDVFQEPIKAVEFYRTHHGVVDIVILDMLMPVMNGRECLARLREVNPAVTVVIVTGYTASTPTNEPSVADVAAFVEKPLDLAAFSKTIERVILGKGAR
ncbi:MAG TPA: ATP-binding protein [Spirochaetia bacterium]|nr:ATP-binding protein [Spirochaetia bacterium]